MISSVILSP